MARIDALDRELKDVEAQWAAFQSGDLAAFNAKLRAASLPPVTIAAVELDKEAARGGRVSALIRGLVGTRFYGDYNLDNDFFLFYPSLKNSRILRVGIDWKY